MNGTPTIFNGSTIYGPFGQRRLRHPAELPLVIAAVFCTVGSLLLYGWALFSSQENCVRMSNLILRLIGVDFLSVPDKAEEGALCSEPLTLLSVVSMIVQIIVVIGVLLWVLRAFLYARQRAGGVRMSQTQFPEGYKMVVEAAQRYGLRRVPDAYVLLGNGQINAFASGHGYRRFIAVYSDLFEVGGAAREPEALRFIINHEVGHIAAGHVSLWRLLFTFAGSRIPILGQALSRAQEYTADNYGYDASPSGSAGVIGVLGAGKYLGAQVNFHAVADRSATEGGFWLHVANWLSTHPILTWRAQALRDRSRPGRLMIHPRASEGAQWAVQIQPSGKLGTSQWPTPGEVLATFDVIKPATPEEQFGRYPGRNYSEPADTLRLANPALFTQHPGNQGFHGQAPGATPTPGANEGFVDPSH